MSGYLLSFYLVTFFVPVAHITSLVLSHSLVTLLSSLQFMW